MGHVGGANINPAVSLALFATGESNIVRVLFFIVFQMLGSVFSRLTLVNLAPAHLTHHSLEAVTSVAAAASSGEQLLNATTSIMPQAKAFSELALGLTLLSEGISHAQGFEIELLITFVLVFCIFASIDPERNDLNGSVPLSIGFAITVGSLFGGKFTGGSMNPARSFGPAFVMQNRNNHWIYWLGPISGAVLAGYVYKLLVVKKKHLIKS